MNASFTKLSEVSTSRRYLLTYQYGEGEHYRCTVEVVTVSGGGFSELVLRDAFSQPTRLTRHDLRVVAELLRRGIVAAKDVGLVPLGEGEHEG